MPGIDVNTHLDLVNRANNAELKVSEARLALLRLHLDEHLWKLSPGERAALVDLYNVLGIPIPKN